jgi:hypothetical protein
LQALPKAYQVAIEAAIAASKAIMEIYRQDFSFLDKSDGSPVTKADLASSRIIEKYLSPLGIPITGEESDKAPFEIRQSWIQSWCIDPLDGTKEFIKRNDEFAVNIALINNKQAIFGLIASPVKEEILIGGKDIGLEIGHTRAGIVHIVAVHHTREGGSRSSGPRGHRIQTGHVRTDRARHGLGAACQRQIAQAVAIGHHVTRQVSAGGHGEARRSWASVVVVQAHSVGKDVAICGRLRRNIRIAVISATGSGATNVQSANRSAA